MGLPASVRLNRDFDIDRLLKDLEAAQSRYRSAPQIGAYHDGSWTGIALRAIDGDYKNTLAMSFSNVDDTEVLKYCPYFKEILDSMPFPVGVTRILFLPPGKKIEAHHDKGFSWAKGHVRLHIPIVTDPGVKFHIGEESVYWPAGQLWFGDFNQSHWLHNQSDIVRVHIVMDCFVTNELLSLFPEDAVNAIRNATAIKTFDAWRSAANIVDPAVYTGFFKVPGTLSSIPLYGEITANNASLDLKIFGIPFGYRFNPLGGHRFQGLTSAIEFDLSADRTTFDITFDGNDRRHKVVMLTSLSPGARFYSLIQTSLIKGGYGLGKGILNFIRFTKRVFKTT